MPNQVKVSYNNTVLETIDKSTTTIFATSGKLMNSNLVLETELQNVDLPTTDGKYVLSHENGTNTYELVEDAVDVNKVKQNSAITTNSNYPVLLAESNATTEVTGYVNKSSTLTYNPSTNTLSATNISATNLSGNGANVTNVSTSRVRSGSGGLTYKVANGPLYRYMICFQSSELTMTPANTSSNNPNVGKTLNTEVDLLLGGMVGYYDNTSTVNNNNGINPQYLYWRRDLININYSFNTANTILTMGRDVYVTLKPQLNGMVRLSSNSCITQTLPTSEDGLLYFLLGNANGPSGELNFYEEHPVYFYKDGAIRIWTNSDSDYPIITDNHSYIYRKTDGDTNVPDGQSEYDIVYGTVCYNQLITANQGAGNSITFVTNYGNGKQGTLNTPNTASFYVGSVPLVQNHIYFISAKYNITASANAWVALYPNNTSSGASTATVALTANKDTIVSGLVKITPAITSNCVFYAFVSDGTTGATIKVTDMQVVDLTQWFGNPDIAEELLYLNTQTAGLGLSLLQKTFRQFNGGYLTTNATGTLMSCNPSMHKTTNRNIFGSSLEFGNIDTNGQDSGTTQTYIRSVGYTDIMPNTEYNLYAETSQTIQQMYVLTYDINKTLITRRSISSGSEITSRSATFTTEDNACYVRMFIYKPTNYTTVADVKVCLNKSDSLNGTYTPHEESTVSIVPVEGHGLYKLGLDDEFYCDGDVRHHGGEFDENYKMVDLGDFDWTLSSNCFYTSDTAISHSTGYVYICGKYGWVNQDVAISSMYSSWGDKRVGINSNNGRIYITDTSYTSASDFKTGVAGTKFVYKVKTPTTKSVTPYSTPQQVWTNGTEQFNDYDYDNNQKSVELPVGVDATYYSTARYVDDKAVSTLFWEDI